MDPAVIPRPEPSRRGWWLYSGLSLVLATVGTAWLSTETGHGPSAAQLREATAGRSLPLAAIHRPHAPAHLAVAASLHRPMHSRPPAPPRLAAAPANWPAPLHLAAWTEPAAGPEVAPDQAEHYLLPSVIPAGEGPGGAPGAHLAGRVVLGLQLAPSGQVSSIWLQHSSGDAVLDDYAVRHVQRWRFPPPSADRAEGLVAVSFQAVDRAPPIGSTPWRRD